MAAGDVAAAGVASAVGERASNPAVRLAVAILLFWLAGLLFFIAFGSGAKDVSSFGKGGGLGALRDVLGKVFSAGQQATAPYAQEGGGTGG
jgi:hypothetical protein